MFFIPGFFLILSLQVSGIFGLENKNPPPKNKISPTEMLKRAENAENHGDYDRAFQIYRQLTPEYEEAFGPEDPTMLNLHRRLYAAYFKAQKFNEALPLAWKIYKLQEKIQGPEHLDTAEALAQLGNNYYVLGKWEKAEQIFKRAYRLIKFQLGQNHKTTIRILYTLANIMWTTKLQELKGQMKELEENGKETLQNPHEFDLILRYFQKVYEVWSKDPEMGEEDEETLKVLNEIGVILNLQQKPEEATEVMKKVYEIRTRILGVNHPLTQQTKEQLFLILSKAGELGQAKKFLGADDEQSQGKDDEKWLFLVLGKANVYEEQGKYAKTLEILTEFYEHEMLKTRQLPHKFLMVLEKLIVCSQLQGDLDETVNWVDVAIDLVKNQHKTQRIMVTTDEHWENMRLLQLYAIEAAIRVFSQRKEEAEIDEYYAEAVEVIKGQGQGQDQGHQDSSSLFQKFLEIQYHVANFKERIGKTDEAVPLYLNLAKSTRGGKEDVKMNKWIERMEKTQKEKTDQIPNIPEVRGQNASKNSHPLHSKSAQSEYKTEKTEL